MVILYLSLICIFTILIKIPYLQVPLDADFGIYGYHGLFWLRKQRMPVRDTQENHPPGRWLLYAFLLNFFAVSRSLFRYSAIFFMLITQIAVFIISSAFLPVNFAFVATLLYGILVSLPTFVWVQSSDEIEQSAFTALAIALVCISPVNGNWVFVLAGLMSFMALFFKQSAYINTFPPVLIAIALIEFTWNNYLLFFAGAIPGLFLTGFYFYKKRMFPHFLDIFSLTPKAFLMHLDNIFYGRKNFAGRKDREIKVDKERRVYIDKENQGFQSQQKQFARDIYGKFFRQTLVFTIFIPLIFLGNFSAYTFVIIIGSWLIFALIAVYLNKHIMPYHLLPVAAPMAILSALGIYAVWNKFFILSIPIVLVIVILSLLLTSKEIRGIFKREKVQRGLMYINHPNEWLFFTLGEKIGKSLQEVTTREDEIYVWGAQYEIFLWAERPSPTNTLFCPHPSVTGYVPAPFREEENIMQSLESRPPKYIVVIAETRGFVRFQTFLNENYYRVQGKDEEIQIFRWIYADILSNDDEEARRRKKDLQNYSNYLKNMAENITEIKSLLKKGQATRKPVHFQKILEINPFHPVANKELANIYHEKGDVNGIMRSLHYLRMDKSNNYFVAKKLGEICLYNKIYDQSEKLFRQALLLDPFDYQLNKILGISLFYQQEFEESGNLLEIYLLHHPEDLEALEKLMEIYWFTNRKGEALYLGTHILKKPSVNQELAGKINSIKNIPINPYDQPAGEIKVVWEGDQFAYHSLALVNREQSLRLAQTGYNLSLFPYKKDQFQPEGKWKQLKKLENKQIGVADIHVRHQWPPKLKPPKTGHWVVIQPWEFGFLPEKWVNAFNDQVDEMWVPSTYVKQVYLDSGIDRERVFVVPNGVDTERFNPEAMPYKLQTSKKFKFLFIGGTIYRKGIDILLESYINTFSRTDEVCLVIKDFGGESFYKNQNFKEKIATMIHGKNNPEIEYIDDTLSDEELVGLYTACDVLVHPYRGEGFGLPILEAMACGIPTIITNGGAALDFCNKRTSLLVKAEKRVQNFDKVSNEKLVEKAWFWEADKIDLAQKMQFAWRNPDIMTKMGRYAADYVKKNWDWNVVTFLTQNRIQKLASKPIIRFQKDIFKIINEVNEAAGQNNLADLARQYQWEYEKSSLSNRLLGWVLCAKNMQDEKTLRKYLPHLEKIYGDNSFVLNLIGIIYFELGEPDKAIDNLKKSLAYNEDSLDPRRNLAEVYILTEQYEEGIKEFIEVIKRHPADITALSRMAQFSLETGRVDEAGKYISRILEGDPQNELALQLKSQLENHQNKGHE